MSSAKGIVCLVGLLLVAQVYAAGQDTPDPEVFKEYRLWVQEMKEQPRGPFSRIRWFCNDGMVLPPKAYACVDHEGGRQHGEWSPRTRQLRSAGFPIATLYADFQNDAIENDYADPGRITLLLLEQFLIHSDRGWVLRRARFYRGAFQAEDEAAGATRVLLQMIGKPDFRNSNYLLLREMVRLLPYDQDSPLLTEIRGLASRLAESDPGFSELRSKIHVRPDPQDAQRVRDYVQSLSPLNPPRNTQAIKTLEADFVLLSTHIETAYRQDSLNHQLQQLASRLPHAPSLHQQVQSVRESLSQALGPARRLAHYSSLLAALRDGLNQEVSPERVLSILKTSLLLERSAFAAGNELATMMEGVSRAERLQWLELGAKALYGSGFLTRREWRVLHEEAFKRLDQPWMPLADYREELNYLERLPGWAQRRLEYYFGSSVDFLAMIDPLARQYVPDRLRSSPLLFYAQILESLMQDSQQLSRVHHQVFGVQVASGLRPLNPGIARGVLSTAEDIQNIPPSALGSRLLVTSATTAELPPVAGILTASEGNELSHVQLLARNLGIPNVVVSPILLERILNHRGATAVLAVSPGGVVRLEQDSPDRKSLFKQKGREAPSTEIRIDRSKLDLRPDLIPLSQLRALDSGRRVGPKAAQLGELMHHFKKQVSPGLVIPFGVFGAVLEQPMLGEKVSAAEWLARQYRELDRLEDDRKAASLHQRAFLQRFRDWLKRYDFDQAFRDRLQKAMVQAFGPDGSYGVFVRSDTNVEDLPGFTGAGLNLTLPNVVGFEQVLEGIKSVWAAAFSERAFAWRQRRMNDPELVYVSVLLHQSVPVSKSGVMVTSDLSNGRSGMLTVVTNEGVGGGVDGQAAESLRVDLVSGEVRLLASSTASKRRVLLSEGGSALVPATATDQLLKQVEMAQLLDLVSQLPEYFAPLRDDNGNLMPADIEFGFLDEQLMLFQIRPFLNNPRANQSQFLNGLDLPLQNSAGEAVMLAEAPESLETLELQEGRK